jgi:hypothetical protein
MFEGPPSEGTMSLLGLTEDDYEVESVEPWPENAEAADLFRTLRTQWRMGPAGPAAFDYTTLFSLMALMGVEQKHQVTLLQQIRIMEAAALEVIHDRE